MVYVNRKSKELQYKVYFVGVNEEDAGIKQLNYVDELLKEKGNVGILMGELGRESIYKRTEGVEKTAEKYPEIKIIKKQTGKYNKTLGMTLTENWLASGEKIDAILANNDEMALGAIKAIKANGKLGDIIVGGIGATNDALNSMDNNELDLTILQDGNAQGRKVVDIVLADLKGGSTEQETFLPLQFQFYFMIIYY